MSPLAGAGRPLLTLVVLREELQRAETLKAELKREHGLLAGKLETALDRGADREADRLESSLSALTCRLREVAAEAARLSALESVYQ